MTPRYDTLAFDVLGTVLDEPSGLAAAAAEAAGDTDPVEFTSAWEARIGERIDAIRAGEAPYEVPDVVHRAALIEVAGRVGVSISQTDLDRLSRFGHRLAAFPDSLPAFERLSREHALAALTTAGLDQAFDMSRHSGLRWTTLISCELIGAYKPDPRTYRFLLDRLGLAPERTLFVAAHPWDLDAAAEHGMHTAYVDRAASAPDQLDAFSASFDHVAADLSRLADLLRA